MSTGNCWSALLMCSSHKISNECLLVYSSPIEIIVTLFELYKRYKQGKKVFLDWQLTLFICSNVYYFCTAIHCSSHKISNECLFVYCSTIVTINQNNIFELWDFETNKLKKLLSGFTTDLVHLLEGRLDPLLGELDGVPVFMSVGRHLEQPRQQQWVLRHSLNWNLKVERKHLLVFWTKLVFLLN